MTEDNTPAPTSAAPGVDPAADYIIGNRIVAYHVAFARVVGSATAALLLSQLYYWSNNAAAKERDGWFYKTAAEIEDETGLTRREQETARRILRDQGVIAEERRGLPAKLWYRVDKDRLFELVREHIAQYGGKRQTSMAENAILDETNPPIRNGGKRASTTETTALEDSQKIQHKTETSDVGRNGSKFSLSRHETELVQKVITLTGDEHSVRRYRQLVGITLDAGHEDLWNAAYKATEGRLRKSSKPLDSVGAYFCGTLVKLLNKEGVPIPVGTTEERADVRAQIADSFENADRARGA